MLARGALYWRRGVEVARREVVPREKKDVPGVARRHRAHGVLQHVECRNAAVGTSIASQAESQPTSEIDRVVRREREGRDAQAVDLVARESCGLEHASGRVREERRRRPRRLRVPL